MYVHKVQLKDFRSLKSAEIDFVTPNQASQSHLSLPNVTLLLGDNGAGKTSILRGIALSVLGPMLAHSSGFVPNNLVRRGIGNDQPDVAQVEATLQVSEQDVVQPKRALVRASAKVGKKSTFEFLTGEPTYIDADTGKGLPDISERLFDDKSAAFFMVGYGATRRVEAGESVDMASRAQRLQPRYQRVAGLFEDHFSLVPLSFWLPSLQKSNPGRFKQVVTLVNKLLPAGCDMTLPEKGATDFQFSVNGVQVPFRALSDGYRAYIGWIGDMLYHLCMGAPSGKRLDENQGLVMVDEIDLHLHPSWQRVLLETLAKALPSIQFIVTTHSPLVVGTLQAGNIRVLDSESGVTTVRQVSDKVHGLSADQILTSAYFGLESTRAPGVVDELLALSRRAVRGDSNASLEYLERLAGKAADASDGAGAIRLSAAKRAVGKKASSKVVPAVKKSVAQKKK